jgi:DNA-directed RNA polymerase specialized sigma24 family protein
MREAEILFDRLIRPIENKMIGIVWRIIRDPEDYKDVFQNVLEQIWTKLERINQPDL